MLTGKEINSLKSKDKTYKGFDGNGLYPEVLPSGVKTFRVKVNIYVYDKSVTVGHCPELSLREARAKVGQTKADAICCSAHHAVGARGRGVLPNADILRWR